MKISVADLKKALKWVEGNSNDVMVKINAIEPGKIYIECQDKYESQITITLYEDAQMMPKIQKKDFL